jgi:hypothetical protein
MDGNKEDEKLQQAQGNTSSQKQGQPSTTEIVGTVSKFTSIF